MEEIEERVFAKDSIKRQIMILICTRAVSESSPKYRDIILPRPEFTTLKSKDHEPGIMTLKFL